MGGRSGRGLWLRRRGRAVGAHRCARHTTQAALSPSTRGRLGLSVSVGYAVCVWAHPRGVCEARAQPMAFREHPEPAPVSPRAGGARPVEVRAWPSSLGGRRVRRRVAAGRAVVWSQPARPRSERRSQAGPPPEGRGGARHPAAPRGALGPARPPPVHGASGWQRAAHSHEGCPRHRHGSPLNVTPRLLKAELEMGPTGAPVILRAPVSGSCTACGW